MKVGHILRTKGDSYYSISPEQPVTDAVGLMMRHRIGSLVVLGGEPGRLVGIITERDVLRGVDNDPGRLGTLSVGDLMSRDLVTCSRETSVDEAMELMLRNKTGGRVRHLPVLDDDTLHGMISIGDIVESLLTETQFENRLLKSYIKNWPESEEA